MTFLRGAANNERTKRAVAASTVKGPVGKLLPLALIKVPMKPLRAPNNPDITIMIPSLSVQYRADTAGVMSRAAIRTTPTAWIPTTTAMTMRNIINCSRKATGYPIPRANPGSKLTSLNSLNNSALTLSKSRQMIEIVITSDLTIEAA